MAKNTDPYVPSDAVTSHPFWPHSGYWRHIHPAPWTVEDLRRYCGQRGGLDLTGLPFEVASFYAVLRFELDRIEGRHPRDGTDRIMRYKPHPSILSHTACPRVFSMDAIETRGIDLEHLLRYVKRWKQDARSEEVRSLFAALDWDLRTHYGMGDNEIGPPIGRP